MKGSNGIWRGVHAGGRLRESNIELLRVLCMLGIIAHHAVVHGGLMDTSDHFGRLFCYVVLPLGKIGFTCFMAASMWFLVEKPFSAKRLLKTWLEVLFYTVALGFLAMLCGAQFTIGSLIGLFLPIGGSSHGFAAAYLAFYAFMPILNIVANGVTKNQALFAAALLFYLEVLAGIFGYFDVTIVALHPFFSEFLLFVMCWFFMLVIRRWYARVARRTIVHFFIFFSVWILIAVSQPFANGGNPVAAGLLANTSNEGSLLYLLAGFSLFFAFLNVPVKPNRVINLLASTTFGILLLHDHNTLRPYFWNVVVGGQKWLETACMPVYVVMLTLTIFSVGFLIDLARQAIERRIFNACAVVRFVSKIDRALR